jgi:hypothetical protein
MHNCFLSRLRSWLRRQLRKSREVAVAVEDAELHLPHRAYLHEGIDGFPTGCLHSKLPSWLRHSENSSRRQGLPCQAWIQEKGGVAV